MDEIRLVRYLMPHPAQSGSASVNTGPLFRLIKAEIISSYLEKDMGKYAGPASYYVPEIRPGYYEQERDFGFIRT